MNERRSLSLRVKATDGGAVDKDAPYGFVEGIANANICDRYDELVLPSAMAAAIPKFLKNPVLSFGHGIEGNPVNGTMPAGSVLKLWQEATGDTHFRARWANTPEAQMTRGLYNDGDMRGFSVQFITLDQRQPTPEELTKWPTLRRVITQLDLIEIACAVVPVNQGSLATASKALSPVRKLSDPSTGAKMDPRPMSPEETKQLDAMVEHYNKTAESMATVATSLDELRAKASGEDDHAPRVAKMLETHKALSGCVKDFGAPVAELAKAFGVVDPNENDGEVDPPDATSDDGEGEDVAPEDAPKSFAKLFQAAL